MRRLYSAVTLAAGLLAAPASGQDRTSVPPPPPPLPPSASSPPAAAQVGAAADAERSRALQARIAMFRGSQGWFGIPDVADAPRGGRIVAAGERIAGDVAATDGTLDVYGTVGGDAVAYGGDVVVHPGGTIEGDAVAVLGRVRLQGGVVGGEVRSVRGSLAPASATGASTTATVRSAVGLVAGWLAVLVLIGVGVLLFAGGPLQVVVETMQRGFARALLAGVAGQLALVPALLLVVVGLAVTLIGILLIPFAVVALVLAAAGLMTLGFLAVARVTGGALTRDRRGRLSERGAQLRGLTAGILLFVGVWLIAALLTPLPLAATVARVVAVALTWVAVTAGFGAALLSRAGTRRATDRQRPAEPEADEISWQTPTPIGGVVAARRPTSASR